MSFINHGHYKLEQEGNFFVICYGGSWNVEAVDAFFQEFKALLKASGFKKFGIVSDLREWEGSTPEAMALAKDALDYLYARGHVASAHIHNSAIKEKFTLPIKEIQSSRMAFEQFDTLSSALEWMKVKIKELT